MLPLYELRVNPPLKCGFLIYRNLCFHADTEFVKLAMGFTKFISVSKSESSEMAQLLIFDI